MKDGLIILSAVKASWLLRFSCSDALQIPVEMCDRKPGELGEVSSDSSKAFTELSWKAEKSLLNMCKSRMVFALKDSIVLEVILFYILRCSPLRVSFNDLERSNQNV